MSAIRKISDEAYVGPGWENRHPIIEVNVLPSFQLLVTFENGEKRTFDVQPFLNKEQLWTSPLLQPSYFKQVTIDETGSLQWPNEFGFHWSTVYEKSTP